MSGAPDRTAPALSAQVLRNESGSAGVEFALIAPVFVLLLAIIFEIGLFIRAKSDLVSALSAAANQTLAVSATIDDTSAQGVATMLVALVDQSGRSVAVLLNNAVSAESVDGIVTVQANDNAIDACFCPTRTDATLIWGQPVGCGTLCTDSTTAGRFVLIGASATFNPVLGQFGVLTPQMLQNSVTVRLP